MFQICNNLLRASIGVIIFFILGLGEVLASERFLIFDRRKEISPYFSFQDNELRNYAISYFNVITTYHESSVVKGKPANFIFVESEDLYDGPSLDIDYIKNILPKTLDSEEYDAAIKIREGCSVLLLHAKEKIYYSAVFVDGNRIFSEKILCFNHGVARSFGFTIKDNEIPSFLVQPMTMVAVALINSCRQEIDLKTCFDERVENIISLLK